MESPRQKGLKPRGLRGSSLAQAIQGNFDHLMGALRNLTRSHNLVVDDIEALADLTGTHTVELGAHEGRITDAEADIVDLGVDAETTKASNARKPPGGPWYHEHEDAPAFSMPGERGPKGDTGERGVPAFPVPDDEVVVGMFIPPVEAEVVAGFSGDHDDLTNVTADQHHDEEHQHSGAGDGGAYVYAAEVEADDGLYIFGGWRIDGTTTHTITGDENNAVVADDTSVWELTNAGATHTVTGIVPFAPGTIFSTNGVVLIVRNSSASAGDVVLADEDTGSAVSNRFMLGADITLAPGQQVALQWSNIDDRWLPLTLAASGGGGTPGADGADGVDGQTIPGIIPLDLLEFDPHRLDFVPATAGGVDTDSDTQKFTFPYSLTDGQVYPGIPMRACTVTNYRGYSDYARTSDITIDVKKNGTTVFSAATKPKLAAAGGVDTARVPDTLTWADGDIMTIHLSGSNGNGPAVLTMKVVYV
jgi:hypothetical protein